MMAVGVVLEALHFFPHSANMLAGDVEKESQFEGIAYVPENDTFLLLHEVR
jgi:hypothetical protein